MDRLLCVANEHERFLAIKAHHAPLKPVQLGA